MTRRSTNTFGGWLVDGLILLGGVFLVPFVLLVAGSPIILLAAFLRLLARIF